MLCRTPEGRAPMPLYGIDRRGEVRTRTGCTAERRKRARQSPPHGMDRRGQVRTQNGDVG